ncbi:hypothetical protein SAMN05444722_3615 [Rhodovulum sp. ES.010]|uniref:hypothetical protein n=1 Tax=Rhodovulum sp. ES.010 TaxID=1882821 RepID=UPI000928E557|nr:hypothetical protein [Rhodovulum sp. ES.010]SIO56523.1 hypothetical protein SAMN05444722_3615 [Rhodovulum sp. ES.010]
MADCSRLVQAAAKLPVGSVAVTLAPTQAFSIDCTLGLSRGIVLPPGAQLGEFYAFDHLGERFALVETEGRSVFAVRRNDLSRERSSAPLVFAWDTERRALCPPGQPDCGHVADKLVSLSADPGLNGPSLWRRTDPAAQDAVCGRLAAGGTEICLSPISSPSAAAVRAVTSGSAVRILPAGFSAPRPSIGWRSVALRSLADVHATMSRIGFDGGLFKAKQPPVINAKDCGISHRIDGSRFARIGESVDKLARVDAPATGWPPDAAQDWAEIRRPDERPLMQRLVQTAHEEEPFDAGLAQAPYSLAFHDEDVGMSGGPDRSPPAPRPVARDGLPDDVESPGTEMLHVFGVLVLDQVSPGRGGALAPTVMRVLCTEDSLPLRADAMVIDHPGFAEPVSISARKVVDAFEAEIEGYEYRSDYFRKQGLYAGYSMDVKDEAELFMWHAIIAAVFNDDPVLRDRFADPRRRAEAARGLRDSVMALAVEFSLDAPGASGRSLPEVEAPTWRDE